MLLFIYTFLLKVFNYFFNNISERNTLDGIYEVHMTIKYNGDFTTLLNYINDHKNEHSFKIVHAVTSVKINEYMTSHFTREYNERDAIEHAIKLKEDMEEYGVNIVRTKVEFHSTNLFPKTRFEYDNYSQYLINEFKTARPYFEFHIKIKDHKNKLDYTILEKKISKHKGVAISYNLSSRNNHNPLLTVRVYNNGYHDGIKHKDKIFNELKRDGYVFEDSLQSEFCIYDDNPNIDKGWLE